MTRKHLVYDRKKWTLLLDIKIFCYYQLKYFTSLNLTFSPFVIVDLKCQGSPGPGHEARIVANPMKEFIYPEDYSHLHKMYSDFVKKFSKQNVGEEKKHTFKHNLRLGISDFR